MAWAKIDDGWWAHPKVMGLSLSASGLWARALSWSCHQRRDHVPVGFLAMVGADHEHADELVEAGLWRESDDGGWVIHDWAEYQEKSLSEKRAEAGRKGGKASGRARREATDEPTDEANGKQTEVASEADDEAGTHPVPSQPVPETHGARKRATRLPDGWKPDDVTNAALARAHPQVDLAVELAQFRDHAAAKGRTAKDWTAAWRMWVRKADQWRRDRAGPDDKRPATPPDVGSPEWEAQQQAARERAEALAGDSR